MYFHGHIPKCFVNIMDVYPLHFHSIVHSPNISTHMQLEFYLVYLK